MSLGKERNSSAGINFPCEPSFQRGVSACESGYDRVPFILMIKTNDVLPTISFSLMDNNSLSWITSYFLLLAIFILIYSKCRFRFFFPALMLRYGTLKHSGVICMLELCHGILTERHACARWHYDCADILDINVVHAVLHHNITRRNGSFWSA